MGGVEPPDDVARSGPGSGDGPRFPFTVDGEAADAVLPLVCGVVPDADGDLTIGNPVVLPEQTPLSIAEPRQEVDREAATVALHVTEHYRGIPSVVQAVSVGHNRVRIVRQFVELNDNATGITEDRPRSGLRSRLGADGVDDSSLDDYCDTIIVTRVDQAEDIDSVLVPVARGPHSGMAIDLGLAIARQNHASLELLHVYPTGDTDETVTGEAVLEHGADRMASLVDAEITLHGAEEVDVALIEYTESFDGTVVGAP